MSSSIELTMLQNIVPVDPQLIASFLRDGYVGAISVGRAEVGPRALGNRSIIASAQTLHAKDRINGMIKQRQAFQPLAPVCLEEDVAQYFEMPKSEVSLRYMTCALKCKPVTVANAPAIVHADGTARVQAVDERLSPLLAALLRAYRDLTGVGILINTSFNGKGEPIVNTPLEALRAYKALDLDFVIIGPFCISSRLC